jgi:hypothetical protein
VDLTPPPAPTITASYNGTPLTDCLTSSTPNECPESVPFGAKVTYTISSTSSDVVALSYGFNGKMTRVNGRSVTVNLLTPGQTLMTLGAVGHDAADHTSTTTYFQINVGPGLPPAGAWNFDEGSGTTAADSSGKNHPLTVTGAQFDDAGRVAGSLSFDGQDSGDNRATTPGGVVDTSGNFSISAWVRLTELKDAGVVTINGAAGTGGILRYAASVNHWAFYQNVSDTATAAQARIDSVAPPVLKTWTHLLGVFNASDKSISFYVNGRLQATVNYTYTPWKANGSVEVGSYRLGTAKGVFPGSIDDVKIYPRVISAVEANEIADPRTGPATRVEPGAGLVASYPFDAVAAGTDGISKATDTVYGSDLTVAGFAGPDQTSAITEDIERGRVLTTTGNSAESVSINRPLVDASGSFTVTAWVKVVDPTKKQVIVRQAGTNKDSWRLEYQPTTSGNAVWAFSRAGSDVASNEPVEVTRETDQETATQWTALAATYDAAIDELVLRTFAESGEGGIATFTSPFTNGTTQVGKPPADSTYSPFGGLLDDLRIYAGVVPKRQLCIEQLGDESSCS